MPVTITNLQALQQKIGLNYQLDDNFFQVGLIDAGIDPDGNYTSDNTRAVDLCAADLILNLVTGTDIKEGGYTLTQGDRAALHKTRSLILHKYGLSDNTNTLTDRSNGW